MTKEAKTPAAYKVRPNALLSAADGVMYADFIASVPEVDREDEIIFPQDYNVEEWKANPVWLWAHDKSSLPIGAGYRPNGTVACDQSEERLVLGCRFSQANPAGTMTYALYKEGTLKMVSVGFIATKSETMPGTQFGHNGPVTRIINPELVECSCVPVGMNRAAMLLSIKSWDGYVDRAGLASVIDKGHLHGEKMPDSMARDLAPFAEPKRFSSSHWRVKGVSPENKIPKFSSQPMSGRLALGHSFGGPFMASIAKKAPLSAGVVPAKTEPKIETKAVKDDDKKPEDEKAVKSKAEDDKKPDDETKSKAADDPAPAEEIVMSVGGQIFKAAMEAVSGACKGIMEMVPQSDSEDVKSYWSKTCGQMAKMVGEMYDSGVKMFPDYAESFQEPANVAAEYAALGEEPDAAMNSTEEEAELQDEEKADTDDEPKKDDEEGKAVGDVVTKAEFNDWHTKTFGERTPMEAVDELLKPYAERIAALEAQLATHDAALADVETILTAR